MLDSNYLNNEGFELMFRKLIGIAIIALVLFAFILAILIMTRKDKSRNLTDEELSSAFWIPTIFFVVACPFLYTLVHSGGINDIPGIIFSCISGPSMGILALFSLIKIFKAKSISERIFSIFALIALGVSGIFSLGLYIMILNHIPIVSM